jgi:hypothetical protein
MSDIILQGLSGKLNYNVQVVPSNEYTLYGEVISNGVSNYTIYEFGTAGNVISQTAHQISTVMGVFQINLNFIVSSATNRISILFSGAEVTCIYLDGKGSLIDDDDDSPEEVDAGIVNPLSYNSGSMLAMPLGKLKEIIMRVINDPDYEPLIASYINRAQNELILATQKVYRKYVSTLASGYLNMPADCLLVTQVSYNYSPLDQWDSDIMPDSEISGVPLYWYRTDTGAVRIYPIPDKLSDAQVVYYKTPKQVLLDTDYPGVIRADEFLIAWTISRIMFERNDTKEFYLPWMEMAEKNKDLWLEGNRVENQRPRAVRARPYV